MRSARWRQEIMIFAALLSLSGCFRPQTMAECQRKSTESERRDCIEGNIRRDTVVGAGGGAVVGAIIGAAAGGLIGGGRGILIGGIGGGVTGGVAGGAITYYVEHQDADALEDIFASNRRLQVLSDSYSEKNAELSHDVDQLRGETAISRQSIEEQRKTNLQEVTRLNEDIEMLSKARSDYEKAVELKYGRETEAIKLQLVENQSIIDGLHRDLNDANNRIRQLDEMKYAPGDVVGPTS